MGFAELALDFSLGLLLFLELFAERVQVGIEIADLGLQFLADL